MKTLSLLLGVLALLFANAIALDASVRVAQQAATCSVAAIDNTLNTKYKNFLARFDNASDETAPGDLGSVAVDLMTAITPCFNLIGGLVAQEAQEPIKFFTRECPFDKNDRLFRDDPCCNNTLRYNTCCAGREVTVTRKVISRFKPEIRTVCNDPGKVVALVRHFNRRYEGREAFCQSLSLKRLQIVFLGYKSMEKCFKELLEGKSCESHSDCVSGICLPHTQTCAVSPVDLPADSVAKCFINSLPKQLTRAMQVYLGINRNDVSQSDLAAAIINRIYNDGCLTANGGLTSGLNTRADCENTRLCNDGRNATQCPTSQFCGCFCNNNNVCLHPLLQATQPVCEAIGMCQGVDSTTGQSLPVSYINRTECENPAQSFCTASSCYPNCDQTKCGNSGFCVGYPIFADACVKPHTFDENGAPSCASNERNFEFGCIVPNTNQGQCAAVGGTWTPFPKTKTDCENYKLCQEFDRVTRKPAAECTKCGGVVIQPFKWVGGIWRPRYFTVPCQWINRAVVNQNKWVKVLDFVKFITFVQASLRTEFYSIFRSSVMCNLDPIMKAFRIIACSCGTDKQANCFNSNLENNIGILRLFAGAIAHHSLGDATIEISSTSVTATSDNVQVSVVKTDVVVAPEGENLSRRAALQTAKKTIYVTDYKANVGQLVGDGIALSAAPGGSVKLCIKRTEEMNPVVDASYTKGGFAVNDGSGKYTLTDIPIVTADAIEVCGTVSKAMVTYYPCFVKTDATVNPTKPANPVNAANSVVANVWVLALLLVAMVFAWL